MFEWVTLERHQIQDTDRLSLIKVGRGEEQDWPEHGEKGGRRWTGIIADVQELKWRNACDYTHTHARFQIFFYLSFTFI